MKKFKYIALSLAVMVFTIGLQAQSRAEYKALKKEKRASKKATEALVLEENKARIKELVNQRTFVIEATTLYDRNQRRYEVSPNLNFIMIDGDKGVFQFGFNHLIGSNGVGGLTFDGVISGFRVVDAQPKGPLTVTTNLIAPGLVGPATLTMAISHDGRARATVTGSFGARLTLTGYFYDPADSFVYKGIPVL